MKKEKLKVAWVDDKQRILSFMPRKSYQKIEKPEPAFWSWVQQLMNRNYRIM